MVTYVVTVAGADTDEERDAVGRAIVRAVQLRPSRIEAVEGAEVSLSDDLVTALMASTGAREVRVLPES